MKYHLVFLIAAFYFFFGLVNLIVGKLIPHKNQTNQDLSILSRKKRYLVFPERTSFVLTFTGLKAIQMEFPANWNLDLEFDMIWPISTQNMKQVKKVAPKKKPYYKLRRHRRSLYSNFEMALDRLGLPGKNCVLRTICEARTFLHPPGVSFIDDLLRIILSHEESPSHQLDKYDNAYRTMKHCDAKYKCPVSLLEFLLNYDPAVFTS